MVEAVIASVGSVSSATSADVDIVEDADVSSGTEELSVSAQADSVNISAMAIIEYILFIIHLIE